MKKLPIQIVLAIACAVTLNACSSGGSSAPSALSAPQDKAAAEKAAAEKAAAEKAAAEKAAAEKAAAEKAAAEKPTEAAGSFTEALSKGFVANNTSKKDWMARTPTNGLIVTIDNNAGGAVTGQLPQTESFDVLTLNGTKILLFARVQDKFKEIAMRPLSAPDFPNKDFKGEGLVGSIGDSYKDVFQNVRYGVYTVDGKSHLFVQGNPSPWLPGAKYSYEGSAVYGKDGKYSRAQSSAIVDFANKTIDVTITPPSITGHADRSPLKFGGEIKGNTFSGTKNGIETRGGFFGSGGVDLGGIYHAHQGEHQGYNGAYGASNQQRIQ